SYPPATNTFPLTTTATGDWRFFPMAFLEVHDVPFQISVELMGEFPSVPPSTMTWLPPGSSTAAWEKRATWRVPALLHALPVGSYFCELVEAAVLVSRPPATSTYPAYVPLVTRVAVCCQVVAVIVLAVPQAEPSKTSDVPTYVSVPGAT